MTPPIERIIETPAKTRIQVGLAPAHNALQSLMLLTETQRLSGLADWVVDTADQLTPDELERHHYVMIGFYNAIMPQKNWPSFPAYLKHLAAADAVELRDQLLDQYAQKSIKVAGAEEISLESALSSEDQYLAYLEQRFDPPHIDPQLERWAYHFIIDPPAMQQLIVSHLQKYWDDFLQGEWERVRPTLQQAVDAYRNLDLNEMENYEAAVYVLGQSIADEQWKQRCKEADGLFFAPSLHVGPYVGKFSIEGFQGIFFGARLPENAAASSPELSQADLYVRLSALADETRLQILKLISTEGESCSTEIISALDLSQSAASRHLKQLTAAGYLVARRKDGAKCFRLDKERIGKTLDTIRSFLNV